MITVNQRMNLQDQRLPCQMYHHRPPTTQQGQQVTTLQQALQQELQQELQQVIKVQGTCGHNYVP